MVVRGGNGASRESAGAGLPRRVLDVRSRAASTVDSGNGGHGWRPRRSAGLGPQGRGELRAHRQVGLEAKHEREPWLTAMGALGPGPRRGRVAGGLLVARSTWRQEQLESPQGLALGRMEEPEGADTVHALGRDVLQESPQHLVGGQSEDLVPSIAAISVPQGYGAVVHREQRAIGHGGAVHVAAEVFEDLLGAMSHGLGEDDPALLPGDGRQWHAREGSPSEREKPAAEELAEGADRCEKSPLSPRERAPGAAIRGEAPSGDEHVDVGVPLQCARPRVEDGEGADLGAEEMVVAGERSHGLEGCAEEGTDEGSRVRADRAAEPRPGG